MSLSTDDVLTEPALQRAAESFVSSVVTPAVIYLQGELGSGKTTFVRCALQALGYCGRVKSPTFSLVESYEINELTVHHLDLYRLGSRTELEDIGFRDLLQNMDLMFIEWPERASGGLPPPDYRVRLDYAGDGRRLNISQRESPAVR